MSERIGRTFVVTVETAIPSDDIAGILLRALTEHGHGRATVVERASIGRRPHYWGNYGETDCEGNARAECTRGDCDAERWLIGAARVLYKYSTESPEQLRRKMPLCGAPATNACIEADK